MKKHFTSLFLVMLLCSCKSAQTILPLSPKQTEKTKRLDSLYREMYQYGEFNGNVLIAENDTIILHKSYGIANREKEIPLDTNSVFNLASITKQFTATAIYLLANDNKLSLDDDLTKFLPELQCYKGITINHLIHHTSGLPDYMNLYSEKGDQSKLATNDYIIELFVKEKPELLFKPNEKWNYSNTGYALLASIIERVSHTSYPDFLRERIFSPLNMTQTNVYCLYKDNLKIKNLAIGYEEDATGNFVGNIAYAKSFDGVYGQGRIYSTTSDLFKWLKGIKSNQLLSAAQTKSLFTNYQLNSGENTNYGFGWFLNTHKEYGNYIDHTGNWAGYIILIEQHLDNNKTVIMLQNNGNATGKTKIPFANTQKIMYGQKIEPNLRLSDEILNKYAGIYVSEKGSETKIFCKNKSLWVMMNSTMKFELLPNTTTQLTVDGFSPTVTYEFFTNPEGIVEKCIVEQPAKGVELILKKKK
ncbi:MAG: serine hydrolase domain-containing protein [Flavobacterium sp.]